MDLSAAQRGFHLLHEQTTYVLQVLLSPYESSLPPDTLTNVLSTIENTFCTFFRLAEGQERPLREPTNFSAPQHVLPDTEPPQPAQPPQPPQPPQSQPELVGNPVSLRPLNWPKGGAMDLLGIPGLNLAQESGREGLEPSQGGAFLRPRLHWRVGKKSEF